MIPRYGRGLCAFALLVLPRIVRFQLLRLWHVLEKAAMMSVIFLMLATVADVRAEPVTVAKFDLENRQAAINWIEAEIADVKDRGDVAKLIDELVEGVLSDDEGTAEQSDIDWQATEGSLKALLGLFDMVLGGGSNRFLVETVLGGVVLRLIDIHPDPGRLSAIVRSNSADLAKRLFERNTNQPITFADEQRSFAASNEPAVSPLSTRFAGSGSLSETERSRGYSLLRLRMLRNYVTESNWDAEGHNTESAGIPELEDTSPR
jgi:N-acetylglucosaminyldiphosphoundecaprenol N-acetyl-beta-D-mannosaminyltransferase